MEHPDIYEKELCVKLVIYKNSTEMCGQQNIKFCIAEVLAFFILVYHVFFETV